MEVPSESFSRFRWFCTAFGLLFAAVDVGSDLLLSVQYFQKGQWVWCTLTLSFILAGAVCIQIFSFTWFHDDEGVEDENFNVRPALRVLLHILQLGFFTRYILLLKTSFRHVWCSRLGPDQDIKLFGRATDLSMLRLFETFLESVPQLLLQLYIVLEHQHGSTMQYISMSISFINTAWTMVDFWCCLRRSLPHGQRPTSALGVLVYLLYKTLTITARILSLTLLVVTSIYNVAVLTFMWLLANIWLHVLHTDFCTSACLELLYRGIVGLILVFTFFNAKGNNTKLSMTVYYIFCTLQNFSAPMLLYAFRPSSVAAEYFYPIMLVILVSNLAGLGCLILYYAVLHRQSAQIWVGDEVDGLPHNSHQEEPLVTMTRTRLDGFIKF